MNKQTRKSTTVTLVIAILVVAAALATYFWWQSTANDDMVNTNTNTAKNTENTPDSTPQTPSTEPKTGALKVYYVALEDNGVSGDKIGCGDSLVAVDTESVTTNDPVKSSFEMLLANHEKDYGQSGLYNALYQSDLTFQSSATKDGMITVALTGSITQSGTCDAPRIQAQLEHTAMTASGDKMAHITVNGKPLNDILSQK